MSSARTIFLPVSPIRVEVLAITSFTKDHRVTLAAEGLLCDPLAPTTPSQPPDATLCNPTPDPHPPKGTEPLFAFTTDTTFPCAVVFPRLPFTGACFLRYR
eukprot:TRINITY_DN8035_c0_g2_i4.p2 TRINITY_DN8035_c0_g2~~TRINITY_DN8035_c0_g2_i4.p2  ORF type:complete len:101 (-),score=6.58 TRINITY_DN8035_c0_g2_i4:264-566(-)